jgi:hypothetical protein
METPMQLFGKFLAITISMLASGGAIAQTSYYGYRPGRQIRLPAGWAQGRPVQELEWLRYGFPAPAAAWVSAPILPIPKISVIFLRQDVLAWQLARIDFFDKF